MHKMKERNMKEWLFKKCFHIALYFLILVTWIILMIHFFHYEVPNTIAYIYWVCVGIYIGIYLGVKSVQYFNLNKRDFNYYIKVGLAKSKIGDSQGAIDIYEKALELNAFQVYAIFNNIGYAYLRLRQYEKSLSSFTKALDLQRDNGYPLNNMGFAYIMLGQLDKGKECLDKVITKDNILKAYSFRNFGIYYMKMDQIQLAEDYFKKAFAMNLPVDLLEYFYAQLLLVKSEKKEALEYLSKSVQKGETEGIELMNSLK